MHSSSDVREALSGTIISGYRWEGGILSNTGTLPTTSTTSAYQLLPNSIGGLQQLPQVLGLVVIHQPDRENLCLNTVRPTEKDRNNFLGFQPPPPPSHVKKIVAKQPAGKPEVYIFLSNYYALSLRKATKIRLYIRKISLKSSLRNYEKTAITKNNFLNI